MHVAFHAPMKPPDDPVASGDRTMARLLIDALGRAGHAAEVASELRTWQQRPDPAELTTLLAKAETEVRRLFARWRGMPPPADTPQKPDRPRRPDVWLTYHLYHKAPDLVGPQVAAALDLPYVVVEASRAARRAHDAWRDHFALAETALAAADAVCAVHRHDMAGLCGAVAPQRLHLLPPFIDTARFEPRRSRAASGPLRLLAVGMMRPGNKEDCYRLLAGAMRRLADVDLHLTIVGDGPRRATILPLFDPSRTTFLGVREAGDMPAIYAAHDVFVWPAVNEPYGFVFLEAQAAGLPVVGAHVRGVPDIVADGETGLLPPPGDAAAFAGAIRRLAGDRGLLARMGEAAARRVRAENDIAVAAPRLDAILHEATSEHARRRATPANGRTPEPASADPAR